MATVNIRTFAEAVVELTSEKPELYISMCRHPSLYGVLLRVKHKNHFIDRVISYDEAKNFNPDLCFTVALKQMVKALEAEEIKIEAEVEE